LGACQYLAADRECADALLRAFSVGAKFHRGCRESVMRTEVVSRKLSTRITENGTFAAKYDRDATDHFDKSQQLFRIGSESRLFIAPKPLRKSELECTIESEYLHDIRPIRSALPRLTENEQISIAKRIGATLAAIHAGIQIDGQDFAAGFIVEQILDECLREHVRQTIASSVVRNVHGDFACANLFLDASNQLVTLDPEPNLYLFGGAAPSVQSTVYLELGLLVQSLNSSREFSRAMGTSLATVCGCCLDGYEEQSNLRIDRRAVFGLASGIMLVYRKYRMNDGTESWLDRRRAAQFRKQEARRLQRIALRTES
jgi:hypothetical protein